MKKLITTLIIAVALGAGLAMLVKSFPVNARTLADFFSSDARSVEVSDKLVSRTMADLAEFNAVSVSRNVQVEYIVSKSRKVEISVGENVVDSLYCVVEDGVLKIGLKGNNICYQKTSKRLNVKVYGPAALTSVSVLTGADFKANLIDGDKVKFSSSTSGEISVTKVVAMRVDAEASTSGDIKIDAVDCSNSNFRASTSGDIKVGALKAVSLIADAQTSGDVKISVFDGNDAELGASTSGDVKVKQLTVRKLKASASTSGDIDVSGTAGEADFSASTSGDIVAKNLKTQNPKIRKATGGSVKM
ncbi:MAG: DUF2807 domain-containing protein [Muribaculum sp.]|nr:DUF2807 domain-containing protein [Muribaculum sp.]